MTADPRKVPKAFSIDHLTYEEAMEMSHFGANVIHPPTMQPALNENIPIKILNTFNKAFAGSIISDNNAPGSYLVKSVTSIPEIALFRVQGSGMFGVTGTAMRVFGTLARDGINIILITQASSEHSICQYVLLLRQMILMGQKR
jgi:aspartokinase/homoserine dehydrogenase 1